MYIHPPGTWICHEKLLPFVRALGDGEGREILQDIVLLKQKGVHLKQTLFIWLNSPNCLQNLHNTGISDLAERIF